VGCTDSLLMPVLRLGNVFVERCFPILCVHVAPCSVA
jgi:hypothetical protein